RQAAPAHVEQPGVEAAAEALGHEAPHGRGRDDSGDGDERGPGAAVAQIVLADAVGPYVRPVAEGRWRHGSAVSRRAASAAGMTSAYLASMSNRLTACEVGERS